MTDEAKEDMVQSAIVEKILSYSLSQFMHNIREDNSAIYKELS